MGRRALMLGAPATAVLALPGAARASYAMQQAALKEQSWEATGKEKERAAYGAIQKQLDEKRRFRPETGEMGLVGNTYTKQSVRDRKAFDESMGAGASSKGGGWQSPEELMAQGLGKTIEDGKNEWR